MQPQIAVVGAAFASAFAAGVVRSSVGFAVESIEPAVAFVVGELPEVTSRLLAAAVALPFAAAAWPTAVAAAFVEPTRTKSLQYSHVCLLMTVIGFIKISTHIPKKIQ